MAWKLKKATSEREGSAAAAEPASPSAGEQIIDYSAIASAAPADNSSEPAQFAADSSADFLDSRTQAADAAVESFTFAKQTSAESGKTADSSDDWSLDAFAPYQPPEPFEFDRSLAESNGSTGDFGLTHSGIVDFDAEPESLIGSAQSGPTSLESSALLPSEFGVIDFDASEPVADAPPPQNGHQEVADDFGLAPLPELAGDFDANWQLGEAGALDSYEAEGVSGEPTLMSGMAVPVDDVVAPPPALPHSTQPAFDEPGDALSALHSPIPVPLTEPEITAFSLPPEPQPPRAEIDKTLLYGEASDSPGMAEPQSAPAPPLAQPQLTVKFGPFSAGYPITADDLVIGRPDPNTGIAPNISLEYDDAVSRRHARVYSDGGQIMLEDLGSKNGTFLNGIAVAPHQPVPLKPNDKIRIGERTEIDFRQ